MTCLLEPPFRCLPPFLPFSPPRLRCSATPGAQPLPPDPEPDPESLALPLDGPKECREIVRLAWLWSRSLQSRAKTDVLERTNKMGAKSTTLTGLSGTGDVMLTCFVILSRNRTVGVHLGSGEKLDGVATAGAVIALAQKYKVKMPVLNAVARIIDNELTSTKAVFELMNLPQVKEV